MQGVSWASSDYGTQRSNSDLLVSAQKGGDRKKVETEGLGGLWDPGEVPVATVRELFRRAEDDSKQSVKKERVWRIALVCDEVGDKDGGNDLAERQDSAIPLGDAKVERDLEHLEQPVAKVAQLVELDRSGQ